MIAKRFIPHYTFYSYNNKKTFYVPALKLWYSHL